MFVFLNYKFYCSNFNFSVFVFIIVWNSKYWVIVIEWTIDENVNWWKETKCFFNEYFLEL
jgi:hypothetical protein